jgi:hypothetical protein
MTTRLKSTLMVHGDKEDFDDRTIRDLMCIANQKHADILASLFKQNEIEGLTIGTGGVDEF